uniref:Tetraspanin n=1 Tax=Crassostrea virginica TaxID=6565 RepID=A0A8B8B0B1_CRAVI|nr:tetraspanin-6-like [Crassostrea virginica]
MCRNFAKRFLVVFNIIFVFFGSGLLGAGLLLIADPDSVNIQKLIFVDSFDEAISSPAFVLVGFGGLAFLGGLLGCIGVIKQWKWALALNIIILVVIFFGEISGGIMAVVYKSELISQLGNALEKSIAVYKTSPIIRKVVDEVQKTLHCCGVTSYMDYYKYADLPVPSSCCAGDLTTCADEANEPWFPGRETNYIYNEGCLSSLQNQLTNNLSILKGTGFGIASIQIIGIFLTYKFYRSHDF